jgi:hypothetical protein
MSSGPELPVIYENPRFDAATPTLKPVVDRAIRFGGVMFLEWGTLTLIEDSPRYLKIATIIIAILVLAVHESWPWLRMRDRRWYPSLMIALVLSYISIFVYALLTEPSASQGSKSSSLASVPVAMATATATPSKPSVVMDADEIQFRTELRKFVLGPLGRTWNDSTQAAYLTMQNHGSDASPANTLFLRLIQAAIVPKYDPLPGTLRNMNIRDMDTASMQKDIVDGLAAYQEFQDYFQKYCQLTGFVVDKQLMQPWIADDAQAFSALQGLRTFPSMGASLRGLPKEWFMSNTNKLDDCTKSK